MLKKERHQYILSNLNENHRIYITDMSNKLGVSDDTLRRDLAELEQHGLLTKVHGGAISKSGIPFDFTSRMQKDIDKKKNLASKIVSFFKDGDVILIDGGTSNLEVIRQISPDLKITIYTNSFPIAEEVMNYPGFELVFLGGTLFHNSRVTVGIPVYQSLQTIHADWLILGVCSIHPFVGLTGPDREETLIKRLMLERASKKIVLADSNKLNTAENYVIGCINDIDYLVVENNKKEEAIEMFSKYNCKII